MLAAISAAFLSFDLLTLLLTGGVIALIVSTVIMILDLVPNRRAPRRGQMFTTNSISPGAARILAQARSKAAIASGEANPLRPDPFLLDGQVTDVSAIDLSGDGMADSPDPLSNPSPIPATVRLAPREGAPTGELGNPAAGPSRRSGDRAVRAGQPPLALPAGATYPMPKTYEEAMALVSHYAEVDPTRVAEVIHLWLLGDRRVYEEDV